jgi:hypothetical protein
MLGVDGPIACGIRQLDRQVQRPRGARRVRQVRPLLLGKIDERERKVYG